MTPETPRRPQIVIIEDDPEFRAILRGWLKASYDIFSFASAEDLLDSDAGSIAADLIITDVHMPGRDGFSLCRSLRAHPRFAAAPILLLTGIQRDRGVLLGLEAGADAYLSKPVERECLLDKIAKLLRLRENETELIRDLDGARLDRAFETPPTPVL